MMKNLLFPFIVVIFIFSATVSCKDNKKSDEKITQAIPVKNGDIYQVDTDNSRIEWKGFKVFKSDNTSHFGIIKFSGGEVTVKDGKLESGFFNADMNTLENVDLKDAPEEKAKLENHLKNADFFEISKYPTATFEITKTEPASDSGDYNTILEGNLTIKGIAKPVQFLANVSVKDNIVTIATQPTEINREDFGVKFQAPVQNGIIKNEVELQVLIKAQKE